MLELCLATTREGVIDWLYSALAALPSFVNNTRYVRGCLAYIVGASMGYADIFDGVTL